MKPFLKVIEIWTLDNQREHLQLTDSHYGDYSDFDKQSHNFTFGYNEGLPGTAWAEARPVIITDLDHSCFQRKDAARTSGITCAVALPIFAGHYLLAVVVFLCGDSNELAGAIEVWGKDETHPNEMKLINGYYGTLEKFEWISRRISFLKGSGLPGIAWDYRIPQIVTDMSDSATFLRASSAQLEGITTAFAIPFMYNETHEYVLTLLSARGTPIAQRFEIWLPDREHKKLTLYKGHSDNPDMIFNDSEVKKGEGLIGKAWLTGCPQIEHQPDSDSLSASIIIPVIEEGVISSVVAFTL